MQLDVTSPAEIDAAVARVDAECNRLDVLVNNAGILLELDTPVTDVSGVQIRETYAVNLFGVIEVTHAFVPLLRRSAPSRIVNMSTPLGSLSLLSDPEKGFAQRAMLAYSTSKTALNSATVVYANALRGDGVLVNAAWPGFVATDLNLQPRSAVRGRRRGASCSACPSRIRRANRTVLHAGRRRHKEGCSLVGVFVVLRACRRAA